MRTIGRLEQRTTSLVAIALLLAGCTDRAPVAGQRPRPASPVAWVGASPIGAAQLDDELRAGLASPGPPSATAMTFDPAAVDAGLTRLITYALLQSAFSQQQLGLPRSTGPVQASGEPVPPAGGGGIAARLRRSEQAYLLLAAGEHEEVARRYLAEHLPELRERCIFQFTVTSPELAASVRRSLAAGEQPAAITRVLPPGRTLAGTRDIGCLSRKTPLPAALAATLFALRQGVPSAVIPDGGAYSVYLCYRDVTAYSDLRTIALNAVARLALQNWCARSTVSVAPGYGFMDCHELIVRNGTATRTVTGSG